jgi:3-hydroxyisobutyrate dehydrogenase
MGEIGWIGLGKMGLPICRRLRDAGFGVGVLARDDERAARARGEGFDPIASWQSLGRYRVIIAAVPDDPALVGLMRPEFLAELTAEHILIDLSTVSPDASAEVAETVGPTGARYLRAPVSGSTATAARGELTLIASGPASAFEDARLILATFCSRMFHLGPAEEARYLKLAINSILAAYAAFTAEALAIGEAGGVDRRAMLEVICQSAIASPLLGYKREALEAGSYVAAFSVEQVMKDLDLVLSAARKDHVPVPLNALVRQRFEQAYAEGLGTSDFFCLAGSPKRQVPSRRSAT